MNNYYPINSTEIERISTCPICESKSFTPVNSLNVIDAKSNHEFITFFETSTCNTCGLIFRSLRPSDSWYASARSKADSIDNIASSKKKFDSKLKNQYQRYQEISKELLNFGISRGKVLDIGCGLGAGLVAYKEKGFEAVGLEPSPVKNLYGKQQFDVEIIKGTIDNNPFSSESFDLVILSHVLEHLTDPIDCLRKIKDLVKSDGYLYIEVPDASNYIRWWDAFYVPHLTNFDYNTLCLCINKAGLVPLARAVSKENKASLASLGILSGRLKKQSPHLYDVNDVHKKSKNDTFNLYLNGLSPEIPKTAYISSRDFQPPWQIKYFIPRLRNWDKTMPQKPYQVSVQQDQVNRTINISFLPPSILDKVVYKLKKNARKFKGSIIGFIKKKNKKPQTIKFLNIH